MGTVWLRADRWYGGCSRGHRRACPWRPAQEFLSSRALMGAKVGARAPAVRVQGLSGHPRGHTLLMGLVPRLTVDSGLRGSWNWLPVELGLGLGST